MRSFRDSDGDGVGDLRGLIEKLDYLNDGDPATDTDLGIGGIWLMPVMESPSYHGYDCVDYFQVDQEYGTNQLFKEFMGECRRRGIRVVIDLMINHTSSQHPWFQAASSSGSNPYRDWYLWVPVHPGFDGPWNQPVWHALGGQYYYGIFWGGMPDLNFKNPQVTQKIREVTAFWLEDMGVDGLRLDAIRHLIEEGALLSDSPATHQWLQNYNRFIDEIAPQALTVGEIWSQTSDITPYIHNNELDLAFEFHLAESILEAVNRNKPEAFLAQLGRVLAEYPSNRFATFLTNHDQNRVFNQVGEDEAKNKLAATLLLTLPGLPFLYYGEELGMVGEKPDPEIRTPMQWNDTAHGGFTSGSPWKALNADYREKNVQKQSADPASLLSHYRKLIHLRNRKANLRRGEVTLLDSSSSATVAYLRSSRDLVKQPPILVVANFNFRDMSRVEFSLSASKLWPGRYKLKPLFGGDSAAELTVGPKGSILDYLPRETLAKRATYIFELHHLTGKK